MSVAQDIGSADRPIGAETADFFIRVLEGRDTASLEQLCEWRDWIRPRFDAMKQRDQVEHAKIDLQDAYRARLHQAYLRALEKVEIVVLDLDRRIQAQEAGR